LRTVSSESDFDNQLSEALEFFDGSVISYDIRSTGANERIVDGKQSEIHISPHICDIKTDKDKTYSIRYYSYLINVEDGNLNIDELFFMNKAFCFVAYL
jgi:hypothetical protein